MKIALIQCSGGLNIGNEFINAGGAWMVRRLFPEAEFLTFEFYDSCIGEDFKHPSTPLTDSSFSFIERECEWAFLFGGSILSLRTESILQYFSRLKCRKALIGAGCWQYNEDERKLCKKAAHWFDWVITRDDRSFSWFDGAANVLSGIDLAFFARFAINLPLQERTYAVINLDMIREHRKLIKSEYAIFQRKYPSVYVVENTHSVYHDVPGYLFLSYWESFYSLYANAAEVVTNRIHTSLVCISCGTPFRYEGFDQGGELGRNTLFGRVGLVLKQGQFYDTTKVGSYAVAIETARDSMLQDLKAHLIL